MMRKAEAGSNTHSGALDPHGQLFKRRMSDERLQHIADSAILKILQYAITAIAIPLIGGSISVVLDRMTALEKAIQKNDTTAATYELRLQTLERAQIERDTSIRLLTEKTIVNQYEIQSFKRGEERKP